MVSVGDRLPVLLGFLQKGALPIWSFGAKQMLCAVLPKLAQPQLGWFLPLSGRRKGDVRTMVQPELPGRLEEE